MAANNGKAAGETNGGSELSGNVIIKSEDTNQAPGTVRIVASSAGGGGGALPMQILTPQMIASLQQQGLIIQNDGENKGIIHAVKRALPSSSSEQNVTKVVITRNPGNKLTSSANAPGTTNPTFRFQGDGKVLTGGSPIKVISVSQGSNIPKGVVVAGSPSKQTIAPSNKIALPPAKSPGKTIMLASPTTPKKIAPASNSGSVGQTILVKGSIGATPGTITLSSGAVAKVINVVNTTVASSQVSSVQASHGQPVPVQIHAAGQPQPQIAPGVTTLRPAGNLTSQGNVQAVSMPGKTFPCVRLVTVSTNTTTTTTQAKPILQPANAKPIAPAPALAPAMSTTIPPLASLSSAGQTGTATAQRTINIPIAPAQNINKGTAQGGTGNQPRFIMPANAQVKIINAGKLAPGTTLLSAGGNLLQSYAVIPAHYLTQQPASSQAQPANQSSSSSTSSQSSSKSSQLPQPQPPPIKHSTSSSNGMLTSDGSGNRPRKPCNCTKSQCLKLYCDCFANGEFCRNCNCNNCLNNLNHEDERAKAVKACLDRNPLAFHPKIGKGQGNQTVRRHNKGCNCKRSGCLKNYCECYEAKILCSSHCKCVGCKNFEESPERKTLMHLADAAEVRVQQQTAARTKLSSQLQDYPTKTREFSDTGERLPFSFITKEVAEATLQCLMAQADESERSLHSSDLAESLILEEFGRCIMQVIHSAGKAKGVNPE